MKRILCLLLVFFLIPVSGASAIMTDIFKVKAANGAADPKAPSGYGSLTEQFNIGDTYYFNYKYGAVKAELNNQEYVYRNFGGRNFDQNGNPFFLDVNLFTKNIGRVFEGSFTEEQKLQMRKILIEKYTELYEGGFFPGFPDGAVKTWDGLFGLQFWHSDSTANPFSDSRKNVLVLRVDLANNKAVLLSDVMLMLWIRVRTDPVWRHDIGLPMEDAVKTPEGNVYQKFSKGLLISVDNHIETYVFTKGTYEEWLALNKSIKVPSHQKDVSKGYIGDEMLVPSDNSMIIILISAGGGLIILSFLIFLMFMRPKFSKKSDSKEGVAL